MTTPSDHAAARPVTLDTYIGQEKLKRKLRIDAAAAVKLMEPLRHTMFTGPAGSGKTTLAHCIANETSDPITELRMPMRPPAFARALREFEGGILLVDEIHAMSKPIQTSMLGALIDKVYSDEHGREIELPYFTMIGATTEPRDLLSPFLERFETPVFEDYTIEEMTLIAVGAAERLKVDLSGDTLAAVAVAACGVPRHAINLLVTARNIAITEGRTPDADEIFEIAQVEGDGLDGRHMLYLKVLGDVGGGPVGIETLALLMNMSTKIVRNLEPTLVKKRLVELRPSGRELTGAGMRRSPSRRAALEAKPREIRAS